MIYKLELKLQTLFILVFSSLVLMLIYNFNKNFNCKNSSLKYGIYTLVIYLIIILF